MEGLELVKRIENNIISLIKQIKQPPNTVTSEYLSEEMYTIIINLHKLITSNSDESVLHFGASARLVLLMTIIFIGAHRTSFSANSLNLQESLASFKSHSKKVKQLFNDFVYAKQLLQLIYEKEEIEAKNCSNQSERKLETQNINPDYNLSSFPLNDSPRFQDPQIDPNNNSDFERKSTPSIIPSRSRSPSTEKKKNKKVIRKGRGKSENSDFINAQTSRYRHKNHSDSKSDHISPDISHLKYPPAIKPLNSPPHSPKTPTKTRPDPITTRAKTDIRPHVRKLSTDFRNDEILLDETPYIKRPPSPRRKNILNQFSHKRDKKESKSSFLDHDPKLYKEPMEYGHDIITGYFDVTENKMSSNKWCKLDIKKSKLSMYDENKTNEYKISLTHDVVLKKNEAPLDKIGFRIIEDNHTWNFMSSDIQNAKHFYDSIERILHSGSIILSIHNSRDLIIQDSTFYCIIQLIDYNEKEITVRKLAISLSPTGELHWRDPVKIYPESDHKLIRLKFFQNAYYEEIGSVNIGIETKLTHERHWFPVYLPGGSIKGAVEIEFSRYVNMEESVSSSENVSPKPSKIRIDRSPFKKLMSKKEVSHFISSAFYLKYIYNPPLDNWDGCLSISVMGAKGLYVSKECLIVISIVYGDQQFTSKKCPSNLVSTDFFTFVISPNFSHHLIFKIYSIEPISNQSAQLLGVIKLAMDDLTPNKEGCGWYTMNEEGNHRTIYDSPLGRNLSHFGYYSKKPIVLIPGWGGTSLRVEKSPHHQWYHQIIWPLKVKHRKNKWSHHIQLSEDGLDGKSGIEVRAVKDKSAICYMTGRDRFNPVLTDFGPLMDNLEELGYNNNNMIPFGYDWRLSPEKLEERDNFCKELQNKIEQAYEVNRNVPVVVICHGIGNLLFRYFLSKLDSPHNWSSTYIDSWCAVSSPWLGIPNILRKIITGDKLGSGPYSIGKQEYSTFSSLKQQIPIDKYNNLKNYLYIKNRDGYKPSSLSTLIKKNTLLTKDKFLRKKSRLSLLDILPETLGLETNGEVMNILSPPPVNRILLFYGINLDTEVGLFLKYDSNNNFSICNEESSNERLPNWTTRKGIIYETKSTEQKVLDIYGNKYSCSGDGEIPYESLFYPLHWKDYLQIQYHELDQTSHTETIYSTQFLTQLVHCICEKKHSLYTNI